MNRYPVVIVTTVAGLAGVLTFHTRNSSHPLSNTLAIGPKNGQGSSTPPPTTSPSTPGGGTSAVVGAPPPTGANGTASGASEQYGYGVLSVRVTVSGARITDVQVGTLQTAESYSQQLAQQVIPYLRQQVLAAQNAHIDGISGATYTSEAYALSVQSALDQLHFR